MNKLKLFIIAMILLFVPSLLVATTVKAGESGQTVVYEDILIKHPNTKYTHKLEGQNVNLILSDYYKQYEGEKVSVKVVFNENGNGFKVVSITPVSEETDTKTYQGILEKHTNPKYTHKLQGQNVNLILSDYYEAFEGKEVKVQVKFTGEDQGKFNVMLISEV